MKMHAFAAAGFALALTLIAVGCATQEQGPTDQELIAQATAEMLAAAEAKDIDKLLEYYSEDFYNPEFGDKAGFKSFLETARDSGYMDGFECDVADAETVIEGDTATVGPVYASGSFGSASIEFTAKKADGQWLVTNMDAGF